MIVFIYWSVNSCESQIRWSSGQKTMYHNFAIWLFHKTFSVCCLLCWTGLNWFEGNLGRTSCTVHSISAQDKPGRIWMALWAYFGIWHFGKRHLGIKISSLGLFGTTTFWPKNISAWEYYCTMDILVQGH